MFPRALTLAGVLALAACARPAASDDPYTAAYRRLHPSVVLLTMRIPAIDPKRKGQWDDAYGSGVVVESGTWGTRILTDAHVIADARDLRATIGDAGSAVPVRVVAATTPDDDRDLALLEVATASRRAVHLGTARGLEPGRQIGVLGYPIPDAFRDERLGTTVSLYAGRLASVRPGALELDVPIIPGESGGPVFDAQSGEVVGIAASRFDEERAIGFATPADVAAAFLSEHARRPR